jgi:hypothetical protein
MPQSPDRRRPPHALPEGTIVCLPGLAQRCERCGRPSIEAWQAADGCWYDDRMGAWRDTAGRPPREQPVPHDHDPAAEGAEYRAAYVGRVAGRVRCMRCGEEEAEAP